MAKDAVWTDLLEEVKDDVNVISYVNNVYAAKMAMTPQKYIDELKGFERFIFAKLHAGSFSKKLYRLFEYQKKSKRTSF